jgi:hypothetical protein
MQNVSFANDRELAIAADIVFASATNRPYGTGQLAGSGSAGRAWPPRHTGAEEDASGSSSGPTVSSTATPPSTYRPRRTATTRAETSGQLELVVDTAQNAWG